jgi:hypothetical protein
VPGHGRGGRIGCALGGLGDLAGVFGLRLKLHHPLSGVACGQHCGHDVGVGRQVIARDVESSQQADDVIEFKRYQLVVIHQVRHPVPDLLGAADAVRGPRGGTQ